MIEQQLLPVSTVRQLNRIALNRIIPAMIWLMFGRVILIRFTVYLNNEEWVFLIREALNLLFTLLMASLFILRHPTKGSQAKPLEAFIALLGTFFPMITALLPMPNPSPGMVVIGNLVSIIGFLFAVISLAALGRCFGLFPEVRGLIMHGPYRFIRHPLYFSEMIIFLGMILPILSPLSISLFLAFIGVQLRRSINEEKALVNIFPEYSFYRTRTRRLIPFIW